MKDNEQKIKETKKLTLAEMKTIVPTTKDRVRPTAKYLRENETVVDSSCVDGSTMTIYASGFVVYKNEKHQYVLRLDCIHFAKYNHIEDNGFHSTYVPLDDLPWDTAVFLDGEQRIEEDNIQKLSRTTVSMTGMSDEEDEPCDMELDAGVDIARDYERSEEKVEAAKKLDKVLSCLTNRQREIYLMNKMHGLSQRQIAVKLQLNQKTVSESLAGAEKKIKKFLKL